jgi:predicted MPP superfamily phosphohydrolase
MKIAIVQLSDIHIKEKGNSVFLKKEKIVQAFQNEILECEKLFIVVSGDIAYSGEEKEYLLAMDFFSDIRELLIENTRITPYFVFIPGNHDCKFDIDRKAIRELIISTIQEKGLDALNSEMIQECCATQEKYFDFVALFEEDEHINFNDKLLKINSYQIGDYKIVFNCYNTSWISELHEQPGKMLFPYKLHSEVSDKHRGELNITLVHHPLNWLDPINANEFKKHLEEHSEIILTGHEHNQGTNIKHSYEGKQTIFLEGGVLQDSQNSDLSEFNMILLDLNTSHQKVYKYKWNRNIYNLTNQKNEWIPFSRGVNGLYLKHQINKDFEEKLNDPGTSFYHSRKPRLILDDIFVFPNLKEVKISKRTNKKIITKSINCLETSWNVIRLAKRS